ncbi:MAG: hypothetical protein KBB55_00245 [Candidatus Buchananbacteria bacterium]|nr:hypothetical protein [Candidatus Buchananbacteria bacterium]
MKYVASLLVSFVVCGCATIVDRQGTRKDVASPGLWFNTKQSDPSRPVHPSRTADRMAEVDPEMATVNLLVAQGVSPEKGLEAVKEISNNRAESGYGIQGRGLRSGISMRPGSGVGQSTVGQPRTGVIVNRSEVTAWITISDFNGAVAYKELEVPAGGVRYITLPAESRWQVHIRNMNGERDDVLTVTAATGKGWAHVSHDIGSAVMPADFNYRLEE